MPNALAGVLRPMVIGRELASVGVSPSPKSGNQNRRSQLPKMTRLIQRGIKCCGNQCRHRRQCRKPGIGRLTVEHKSACGRPLGGSKLQRQRSVRSVRFFSLTRAVKGRMNSPWTVRTTPAVSVQMRVAFRRGRGICGCFELICYQITKAPAGSGGGLVLSGLRPLRHNEGGIRHGRHSTRQSNSFRALHQGTRAFVIPNAWDAGSARVLAGLGFSAIATSSYATAGAYGTRDGRITRDQVLAHARVIVDATDLPVSVDFESGFGTTANDVAETYRHAAAVGLVGATIEDLTPTRRKNKPLFDIGKATERVAAAVAATRKLGFPFMLTARAEGFRYGNTDLDDAIKRLQAYEKAGADVLMAPGLPDLASVKAVCAAIAKPFNFMAGIPGMSFTVAELEAAGVRRISLAGSLYRAAMGGLVAAAHELKDKGTFGYVDTALPSAELAGFMRG